MFSNNIWILILIFATACTLLIISFALESSLNSFGGLSRFMDGFLVFIGTMVCFERTRCDTIFTFDRHCDRMNCQEIASIAATTAASAAASNNHNKENRTNWNKSANERPNVRHIRKMVRLTHKRRMIKWVQIFRRQCSQLIGKK